MPCFMAYLKGRGRSVAAVSGFPPHPRGETQGGNGAPDRQISSKPARRGETVVSCDLTNRTDDGEYDA